MRGREHPTAARPQHSRHLTHDPRRIGDERHRAEGSEGDVEGLVGERQILRVGLHQRHVYLAPLRASTALGQHSGRQVRRHRARALLDQPARAHGRPATHLEHATTAHIPEQARVLFPQTLRTPHEVSLTQQGPVLGVVIASQRVPPPTVGPHRLGHAHQPTRHAEPMCTLTWKFDQAS